MYYLKIEYIFNAIYLSIILIMSLNEKKSWYTEDESQGVRVKPWSNDDKAWNSVFTENNISIPMCQRSYDWNTNADKDTENQVPKFVEDLVKNFEECPEFEMKMGTIVFYKNKYNEAELWDGQQRTITMLLLLISICNNYAELKNSFFQTHVIVNQITQGLTINQKRMLNDFKKKHNATTANVPKLYCVSPKDREAILEIVNDNYDVYSNYCDLDSLKNNCYKCNFVHIKCKCRKNKKKKNAPCNCPRLPCGYQFKRLRSFIKHLNSDHNIKKVDYQNSKIYNAYQYLYHFIYEKKHLENKSLMDMCSFAKFCMISTSVTVCTSISYNYVSNIFEWENNRGKKVDEIDISKNLVLSKLNNEDIEKYWQKWEAYKKGEITKKLFPIAIQILRKKFSCSYKLATLFDDYIGKHQNTKNQLDLFFKIIEDLKIIYDKIRSHKFGKYVAVSWEVYSLCMLPIFYITKDIDKELLFLFQKWTCRNITNRGAFNNKKYKERLIEIVNNVLEKSTPKYDYLSKLKELLAGMLPNELTYDKYVETMLAKEITYRDYECRLLLFGFETLKTTDETELRDTLHVDHIIPAASEMEVGDQIHSIGNLTLFESTNSLTGGVGNMGHGKNEYKIKKESYKDSLVSMARDLYETYTTFTKNDIKTRETELFNAINKLSKMD